MSAEPRPAPKNSVEAAERLDHLTDMLSKHWSSLDPAQTLDQIATLMGQRRALLAIERFSHDALKAVCCERIAKRVEQARGTVGAGSVAALAEIEVYAEFLRSQP